MSFGDAVVAAQTFVVHEPIEPLPLPRATGGNGPFMYTLPPASLPAELTYTAPADATGGGTLAGMQTEETTYTLTARKDNSGQR